MHKIYLLHAYSPKNSGDGLLVKLSLEHINKIAPGEKYIVCLDPRSFRPYLDSHDCKVVSPVTFFFLLLSDLILRRSVIFFGVGGGYMRASNFKEGAKTLLAHGSQLLLSIMLFPRAKKFYLPQSIGPLNGACGAAIRYLLGKVDLIYCRDDKTISDLENNKNTRRSPDLVAIEILENSRNSKLGNTKNIGIIMRDLPSHKKGDTYTQRLQRLFELLSPATLVVQSEGRGNDDILFYRKYFPNIPLIHKDSFLKFAPPLVVSIRLHGSLESILSGSPSIHIAYERKGHAAYSDLGISEYCFHVSDFDPTIVASLSRKLAEDAGYFWSKIRDKAETFENPLNEISATLGQKNATQ